jgi:hypothetical protein
VLYRCVEDVKRAKPPVDKGAIETAVIVERKKLIIEIVRAQQGCNVAVVKDGLAMRGHKASGTAKSETIKAMCGNGTLVNLGTERNAKLYTPSGVPVVASVEPTEEEHAERVAEALNRG